MLCAKGNMLRVTHSMVYFSNRQYHNIHNILSHATWWAYTTPTIMGALPYGAGKWGSI